MDVRERIDQAEFLYREGRLREAEEVLLQVVEEDPENREAHNGLGAVAFSRGDIEAAVRCFRRAVEIDPEYLDGQVNLREAFLALASSRGAASAAKDVPARNPEGIGTGGNREDSGPAGHPETPKAAPAARREAPIRVIHLPLVIANMSIALSKHLNRLGVDSRVVSYFRTWLHYRGDVNLDLDDVHGAERNEKVRRFVEDFLENEAPRYDIFHFHFFDSLSTGASFGGWKSHPDRDDYWDLRMLKDMGKKIVVTSWGSDVRNNSKVIYYQLRYEGAGNCIPYPPLNRRDQYFKIWKFAQYADAVIHSDHEVVKHAPYGNMIPICIDEELLDGLAGGEERGTGKVSVIHAPSNQFYKGTPYVNEVLQKISGRYGDRVEIRRIQGLSHREALGKYAGYGAAIDQIGSISFGLFALEALYLGRTVFTSFQEDEFFGDDPKMRTPVIAVKNQEDFHDRLVRFLDSEPVDRTGEHRRFILDNFSAAVVARQYRDLYERLLSGKTLRHYVSQEWHREFSLLLSNRKVDERDFYPRVTDVLLRRRAFEKLFHEIRMGMGLNDDADLLAKYMLALELTGRKDQEAEARRAYQAPLSTDAFQKRYARARELYESADTGPAGKR
ncbi:MAG TPA: tetratricopeptide repeat protein [Syntrophales bacterium]|nr:tetratricopeptide repeat protein [Syntrophales bacterium]